MPAFDERVCFADRLLQRAVVHLRLIHVAEAEAEQHDRECAREGIPAEEAQASRTARSPLLLVRAVHPLEGPGAPPGAEIQTRSRIWAQPPSRGEPTR